MAESGQSPGQTLRAVAALLIRGPAAPFVLGDLEESLQRDVARGIPLWRARWRYLRNAVASSATLLRADRTRIWSLSTHFSGLDLKLGVRMMLRYPMMSLVSILGMAVAIAIGGGAYGFIDALLDPSLPLDEGERVVSIQTNDTRAGNPESRVLHDFGAWQSQLGSLEHVSAFRTDSRTLVAEGSSARLVGVAEMSPTGFDVARVRPLMGRTLLPEDGDPGAPSVVVIAEEEWERHFGGDPAILGKTIQLGTTEHTVIGVMPAGFRFPVQHRYWIPLRLDARDYPMGTGPTLNVFARLAEGSSMERAQTELAALGQRMAAAYPDTHQYRRPQVLPYTHPFLDIDSPGMAIAMHTLKFSVSLLLLLIAVNVGVLVYARTATRSGEIAVRSALGASRGRIVGQLFMEALVLSGSAALLGLIFVSVALSKVEEFQAGVNGFRLPFWLDLSISPGTVAYVALLAVVAGVIIGVLPGLRVTSRAIQPQLQKAASRGSGGMQMGRTWTVMIVAQVAIAVAVLPVASYVAAQSVLRGSQKPAYAIDEFLSAYLSIEREEAPPEVERAEYEQQLRTRFAESAGELIRRLEAEAAITGVTFGGSFPGSGSYRRVEVEPLEGVAAGSPPTVSWVVTNAVDPGLFQVFGVELAAGSGLDRTGGDVTDNSVVVDEVFAEHHFANRNAIGRRVRLMKRGASPGDPDQAGPWLDVAGVVPDFTVQMDYDPLDAKLYLPFSLADSDGIVTLTIRVRGEPPTALMGRVRDLAAEVDPGLQLHELRSSADALKEAQNALLALALIIGAVTASVILLSAVGIYAMMSFTVSRRRREIGIRSALGASPRKVLGAVLRRASGQVVAGVLIGALLAEGLQRASGGQALPGQWWALLPGVALLMTLVGLIAALGPVRRGLAVQPQEVLREE